MSTQTQSKQAETLTETITQALHERVQPGETEYVKSRDIADQTELTSRQVGYGLKQLANMEDDTGFTISSWGYSSATSWEVTRAPR